MGMNGFGGGNNTIDELEFVKFRFDYAADAIYDVFDVVEYSNAMYLCIRPASNTPPSDTSYWRVWKSGVSSGVTGVTLTSSDFAVSGGGAGAVALTVNAPSGGLPVAKLETAAQGSFVARGTGGTGALEILSAAQARTAMGVAAITTSINTQYSITGGGSLAADRTISLVNDAATPGILKVYGTDAAGVKGWFDATPASHTHAAADIVSGTIATARLGSGTASSGTVLRGDQTWAPYTAGTVTSVGITPPSGLLASAAITSAGSVTLSWDNQLQALVLASPASSTGTPSFRALAAGDIPSLSTDKLTSGILPLVRGGTGIASLSGSGNFVLGANSGATGYEMKQIIGGTGATVTHGANAITINATGTGGSVLSVGLALPAEITVSGSPVTTTGTLTGAWASQTANKFLGAPSGSSGTPTFRVLAAADIPSHTHTRSDITDFTSHNHDDRYYTETEISTSGSAAVHYANLTSVPTEFNASSLKTRAVAATAPTNGQALIWNNAGSTWQPGSVGTVTSVDLSLPGELTVSGNPVTASGTLTGAWATQTANKVFASATSGGAATPAFRALVAADIPNLDAAKITAGTLDDARLSSAVVTLTGTQTLTNKTLTAPKANQINDANGNASALLTATASAVNYLNLVNSATGNAVSLLAAGSDTNIGLTLTPKGTGKLTLGAIGTIIATGGTSGQAITTDGSGNLSFTTISATAGGSNTQVQFNSSGSFTGSANLTFATNTLTLKSILALAGSSSGTLSLTVPSAVTSHTITLPAAQGGANTFLKNDGSGGTSWANPVAGSTTEVQFNNAGVMGASANFTWDATNGIANINSVNNNAVLALKVNTGGTVSATSEISNFYGRTVGTPAAGFGVKHQYLLNSSTTADQSAVLLSAFWETATHASRTANYTIGLANNGGSPATTQTFRADGEMRLHGATSGYVGIKPSGTTTSYTLVMPAAQGAASKGLINDGSGNLSWGDVGGSDPSPAFTTLTDGATVTWATAGAKVNNAVVTLAGNRTLSITGAVNGQTGVIIVKQDGTGGRTLALPSGSKMINGGSTTFTPTIGASKVDILSYIYDGTNYWWTAGFNYT